MKVSTKHSLVHRRPADAGDDDQLPRPADPGGGGTRASASMSDLSRRAVRPDRFAFLVAYGVMHPIAGRIIDWLGTRQGFALAVIWWSIANMAHAFAGGFWSFASLRFLLGVGEAGNFPGAIKSVSEWFPAKERTVATGIMNVGAGAGARHRAAAGRPGSSGSLRLAVRRSW